MTNSTYDVIIIGGGPTGIALGIELGLHNINTLILEKYEEPLLSPRAQSINERSMELFMRWELADKMRDNVILPKDFPMQGVWCSKLNGVTYGTAGSHKQFKEGICAQKAIRIPLYITENVLRTRLKDFECVTLLKNHKAESVLIESDGVVVTAIDKTTRESKQFHAHYVVGCDGANSITRQSAKIHFKALAPKRRVLTVLFEAPLLLEKITVDKGFLYYIMSNETPVSMGPVDLNRGLWYTQLFHQDGDSLENINFDEILNEATGIEFEKKIINAHFWDMQIQLADHFSSDNRVFLVGDAAHAFAPTGGFGLNTGLGDVTNLGWKLASVIQKKSAETILNTYEQERKPVCLRNLLAAEKNASDAIAVRQAYAPEKDPQKFAAENARIAKQHSYSAGLTMGYAYFDSPLTTLQENQNTDQMRPDHYSPLSHPGCFLPNSTLNGQSIYELLSPTRFTLIVCGKEKIKLKSHHIKILHVPEDFYPSRYLLIRPDWHIALAQNTIDEKTLLAYFNRLA